MTPRDDRTAARDPLAVRRLGPARRCSASRRGLRGPLPLVVAPHPFGWSVEDDYHGGCEGSRRPDTAAGWACRRRRASRCSSRRATTGSIERCSMGWDGVACRCSGVDRRRRRGRRGRPRPRLRLRSLDGRPGVAAHGRHAPGPVRRGVRVQRRRRRRGVAGGSRPAPGARSCARRAATGASSTRSGARRMSVPGAYARRSAFSVLDGLRRMPLTIWWSHLDLIVPRQVERHGKRLYDELKAIDPNAPVSEYNHTGRYALSTGPDRRRALGDPRDGGLRLRDDGGCCCTHGTRDARGASAPPPTRSPRGRWPRSAGT